jgi:P27 family predicted phage terminase small subunit
MRSGPKPKPTHLKVLVGNPGKRRLPSDEPKPAPSRPRAPDGMSERAARVWRYIVPRLDELGLLTQVDRYMLRALCDAVAKYEAATEALDASGLLVKGRRSGEPVRNPLASIQHQAFGELVQVAAMFGLDPADRVRLAGAASPSRLPTLEELLGS